MRLDKFVFVFKFFFYIAIVLSSVVHIQFGSVISILYFGGDNTYG